MHARKKNGQEAGRRGNSGAKKKRRQDCPDKQEPAVWKTDTPLPQLLLLLLLLTTTTTTKQQHGKTRLAFSRRGTCAPLPTRLFQLPEGGKERLPFFSPALARRQRQQDSCHGDNDRVLAAAACCRQKARPQRSVSPTAFVANARRRRRRHVAQQTAIGPCLPPARPATTSRTVFRRLSDPLPPSPLLFLSQDVCVWSLSLLRVPVCRGRARPSRDTRLLCHRRRLLLGSSSSSSGSSRRQRQTQCPVHSAFVHTGSCVTAESFWQAAQHD